MVTSVLISGFVFFDFIQFPRSRSAVAPPPSTVAPIRKDSIPLRRNTAPSYSRPVGRMSRDRDGGSSHSVEESFLHLLSTWNIHRDAALGAGGALPGGEQVRASLACCAPPKSRCACALLSKVIVALPVLKSTLNSLYNLTLLYGCLLK